MRQHEYGSYFFFALNLQVVKSLQGLPNWESRLNYAIDHSNSTDDEKISLKDIISTMKHYLADVADYKPTNDLIDAEITLIKPFGSNKHDNCGLPKVSKLLVFVDYFFSFVTFLLRFFFTFLSSIASKKSMFK